MKTNKLLGACAGLSLMGMTACTLVDPIVVRGVTQCDPVSTSISGKDCAAELRNKYLEAVSDRERLNLATNAGLLTLVTAFGVLAGFDHVDTSTILAGSIGGAALIATPTVFGTDQRDFVYLAGAEAMSCVLDAGLPALNLLADDAFEESFGDQLGDLKASIDRLVALDADLPIVATTTAGQDVKDTLTEAKALYFSARRLWNGLKNTDGRVLNATRSIDVQVNTALVRERTDPVALASALGASTTLIQGQISGFLPPTASVQSTEEKTDQTKGGEVKDHVALAKSRILTLTATTEEMKEALTPFNSSSLRQRCTIDSPDIRPFTVQPRRLIFNAPEEGRTRSASLIVKGGKTPHSAAFIGMNPEPADSLVLSVENTADGSASIKVTATSTVANGTYAVLVESKDGKSDNVTIVVGGQTKKKTPKPDDAPKPKQSENETVTKLQEKLTEISQCSPADGLPLAVATKQLQALDPKGADGVLGSNTLAAINNLLSLPVPLDGDVPPEWAEREGDLDTKAASVLEHANAVGETYCKS